jgi:DNA-binding Lrp family transcriptional regulator
MAKVNDEHLNTDERAILSELQKYSSNNIETIAKHCGFSRQKIYRIIKKLEEKKIIWGYTAIFDEEIQDLQKFLLLVKRTTKPVDESTIKDIVSTQILKEISEMGITIESSYCIHGEFDWALIFTATDLKHAKKFSNQLLGSYADLVDKTLLMQVLYSQRDHHIQNPNPSKIMELL